jgi:ferredoxin
MKIIADRKKCAGHARCAAVSEIFELDSNGYIGFDEKSVPKSLEPQAQRGARACTERALKLIDDSPESSN